MQRFETIGTLQPRLEEVRRRGDRIGLVPTMGNLHEGHLALVRQAMDTCDFVVTTIFVNPTQFGPGEDFERYPRTVDDDLARLRELGCHAAFLPAAAEMYPDGLDGQTVVSVPELGTILCGASRPGHFDGVTTIVNKFFNIVAPDKAFFGCKDFQQLVVIRKMVRDLRMPVDIVGVETQREESGLALSSRNNYLDDQQRQQATVLYRTLCDTREAILAGETDFKALEQRALAAIDAAGLAPEYVSVRSAETLAAAGPDDRNLAVLTAARLGKTRLIDNLRFSRA